jgi:hypothetical protein
MTKDDPQCVHRTGCVYISACQDAGHCTSTTHTKPEATSSKTVTLAERIRQSIAAVKRSEMTARPGGSFLVFSLDMAAEAADALEAMASVGIRQEREIERLREVVTIPLITPESSSSSTLCIRVLAEHEKGLPVNAQDLINALMWRVKNQREQLARLNRRVEEYRTDD